MPSSGTTDLCLAAADEDIGIDHTISKYQAIATAEPDKPEHWVAVADKWTAKAQLTEDPGYYLHTQGCLERALKVSPNYRPALEQKLLVLMNEHEFAEARDLARSIVDAYPEAIQGWATLSDAHLELGEIDEARKAAQELADRAPGMPSHTRTSYFRWLRGDIRGANEAITMALRNRDAKNPFPAALGFVRAAEIAWHRADYSGAKALYDESLKWVPDYGLARMGLARVAMAMGDHAEAIEIIEALDHEDPNADVAWLLGDAHEAAGDQAKADEAHARVRKLAAVSDPLGLARFLITKNEDPERALELIEAERKTRGGIYIDDAYAWALYRLGRFEEAKSASDDAIRLGTKDAVLLYHAGAIQVAAGSPETGLPLLEEAMKINPHFDYTGAKEAAELIARTPAPVAAVAVAEPTPR